MRPRKSDWSSRLRALRGEPRAVETDLTALNATLERIELAGVRLDSATDVDIDASIASLQRRANAGATPESLLPESFALTREAAWRVLGQRPFDVQVLAGIALHQGKLAEMQTGEGKTLAAVLPAVLNALSGRGVHVLTFNDYLARRDAEWMGPLYRRLGISVAAVQEGMSSGQRRAAYRAGVTYATAKEAGFDCLRMQLGRDPSAVAHRPFHYAIVDEADSILIDEARVPLVVAGQRGGSGIGLRHLAAFVDDLERDRDFETDEHRRNVSLTETGSERIERKLACGPLHAEENLSLLTEIHQALHARVLLRRDVDYIVRNGAIELVDEFTGRVAEDRRWPDGLQAALEAKERLEIRPGGRILGSIALQHFLSLYPRLAGMTATARPAAEEVLEFYGLQVVVIPPNRRCVRRDHPDLVFARRQAKLAALVEEVASIQHAGRPVLVGTAGVGESEQLAVSLRAAGVDCRVLNARNDEEEAGIVARAGELGAVTISTNMAGRGTDIRLGGVDEKNRDAVVALGGLHVIGTNRHESRRIDDQLRGRAGRQGDPGSSRFLVSLEDDLMVRYGINGLIPHRLRAGRDDRPIEQPRVRHEIARLQRIVEGQNLEIRRALRRYSMLVEEQRRVIHTRRMDLLLGRSEPKLCARRSPERYTARVEKFGSTLVRSVEREITLHFLDRAWEEHLDMIAHLREGVHLLRIGGLDPFDEFCRQVTASFRELGEETDRRIVTAFDSASVTSNGIDAAREDLLGPSSTWTYLVNDVPPADLHDLLAGPGQFAFAGAAALSTGPLLVGWALWRRWKRRIGSKNGKLGGY